jgi:aspartate-semialdehyde dehydrogenase
MDKPRSFNVAVCGASGAVGTEMVSILEERHFPVANLKLLASQRSAGEHMSFRGDEIQVEELKRDSFTGVDVALFSAGGTVSKDFAPTAVEAGAVVIDNTSAFRMEPDIPLVVPEVNPEDIAQFSERGIIANPNCSTIQMVVVLKPIEDAAKIQRVVVSTYQSVSGAGRSGIRELESQSLAVFNLKEIICGRFPRQIAFNCVPHIDVFAEDGYSEEEHKMINESRKILHRADLKLTATTVRVPVFFSHCEAVNVETERKLTAKEARQLLSKAPGVRVIDDVSKDLYPTSIDAVGLDDTLVGRIREDPSLKNGLDLWVAADNVRKGAALNAVQIAERLVEHHL